MRNSLEGQRFGRLTVLEFAGVESGNTLWKCRCHCGKRKVVLGLNLKNGATRSCGCLNIEMLKKMTEEKRPGFKHGHAQKGKFSPEYESWRAMWARCSNPKDKAFKYYGGRGITVCDRWMRFENFLADMGERPEGLTLERKNNNAGYFKENCKWATWREQHNNQRKRKGKIYEDGRNETLD